MVMQMLVSGDVYGGTNHHGRSFGPVSVRNFINFFVPTGSFNFFLINSVKNANGKNNICWKLCMIVSIYGDIFFVLRML